MSNDRTINKLLCIALFSSTCFLNSCSSSQEEEPIDPIEAAQIETTSAGESDATYGEEDALLEYQAAEAMPEAVGSNEITSEAAIQETLGDSEGLDSAVAGQEELNQNPLGDELDELSVPQEMDTISESEMAVPAGLDTTADPVPDAGYAASEQTDSSLMAVSDDMMEPEADAYGSAVANTTVAEPLLAETGDYGQYIVQPGDMLGFISLKVMGTSKVWQELAALNDITDPANLQPGDIIRYPINQRSQQYKEMAENLPFDMVTVEPGDTLGRIAGRVLGSESFWRPLWRMNIETVPNPNQIVVGQTLRYVDPQKRQAAMEEKGWNQFGH